MKLLSSRIIIFLLIGLLFLSISPVYAEVIKSFNDTMMGKLKNGDFENLFNDFYIPKDYNKKDIQNDKETIIAGLRELIQNELGLPDKFSGVNAVTEKLITINLATGTHQTVVSLPSRNFFYKVTFSKFGDGYIEVGVSDDGEKSVIKNINIGLPSSDPNSMHIAQYFGKFMMGIAMEQQKRNSSPAAK